MTSSAGVVPLLGTNQANTSPLIRNLSCSYFVTSNRFSLPSNTIIPFPYSAFSLIFSGSVIHIIF